ncbi:hypothetical protein CNR22_06015 [Sphingobacteriaceae bacterium]|nr:hypothetical protein CNR22_06015 [Sphingobacteriaceae bacterium]
MKHIAYLLIFIFVSGHFFAQEKINRKEVVQRHRVELKKPDTLSSLTVGNGEFAFTADITGLQTFPKEYQNGVPLGTQSEWGWHSFPNTENYKFEETFRYYDLDNRKIPYSVQLKEQRGKDACEYFRKNAHRLQLANIGMDIYKKDGTLIQLKDLTDCSQTLDPWSGELSSTFNVEGEEIKVTTYGHQQKDLIGFKINSNLLQQGKIKINIKFPFPTAQFSDMGVYYGDAEKHSSQITTNKKNSGIIKHTLDTSTYFLNVNWSNKAELTEKSKHYFSISPDASSATFECTILFTKNNKLQNTDNFASAKTSSETSWEKFWQSGGAIDFSGSTDTRANELERRIILSQYLTKVQCAGNCPPQETGLTYNSWYGKPHLEMYWWHAAHFALWNRTDLLEKSMQWYFAAYKGAQEIAKRQGYKGARWQKMTDNAGNESPSSIGALLIWQQPHLIYLADLVYKTRKDEKTLDKYKELVFATADFMASFPQYDKEKKHYNLGKGLIPAQECFNAADTYNPTYELAYWHWALNKAQEWRILSGLERKKEWDDVIKALAPLPQKNGVYLAAESVPDCYAADSKYLIDHPAVLAALSTIPPSNGLDTAAMHRTFNWVDKVWTWEHTWGWDFPLVAMTAVRLNSPKQALDALFMNVQTNTYLPNGHNYQDERLTIYLPGNGGLLSAVALMCAGSENSKIENPGFPKDGSWKVKWENLNKMP